MPRLPNSLLIRAYKINPLLATLLRSCRTLESAGNELRWLREHARKLVRKNRIQGKELGWRTLLRRLCRERSLGKPLQYLLGSEFFGQLEIQCRKGVLIPRQETAEWVTRLARLISQFHSRGQGSAKPLQVADFCTGTGCMSLLFCDEFYGHLDRDKLRLKIVGVDISATAVKLAQLNRLHEVRKQHANLLEAASGGGQDAGRKASIKNRILCLEQMQFLTADIFDHRLLSSLRSCSPEPTWDIMLANPPYVSPASFDGSTTRSVRKYEPKIALVPSPNAQKQGSTAYQGDLFYPQIFAMAEAACSKLVALEVEDINQATRVCQYAEKYGTWDAMEIWCDHSVHSHSQVLSKIRPRITLRGNGNARVVICSKGIGARWLQETPESSMDL